MSSIDQLLAQARAAAHKPRSGLSPQPRLRIAILTCMDARIDPVWVFGLGPGDAHVLRNAGARATPDVMRSLALSQAILGTREVLVLGHTGCGLLGRTEHELAEAIRSKTGHRPSTEMGAFKDLDKAVADSVDLLRRCPFLAQRDLISGYVYDLDAGTVRPVAVEEERDPTTPPTIPLAGLKWLRADVLDLKRERPRRH